MRVTLTFLLQTLLLVSIAHTEDWEPVREAPLWPGNYGMRVAELGGKLFLTGGQIDFRSPPNNNLYVSLTGENWTQVETVNIWSPRMPGLFFSYQGKLWLLGGAIFDGNQFSGFNEIWSSPDGVDWTLHTEILPVGFGQVLELNGKLYSLGVNATWESTDARNWTKITDDSYGPAYGPFATFKGKFYRYSYESTDGINWVPIANNGNPYVYFGSTLFIEYQNELWAIGGESALDSYSQDFLGRSMDIANWYKDTSSFDPDMYTVNGCVDYTRIGHSLIVFKDSLFVIGGQTCHIEPVFSIVKLTLPDPPAPTGACCFPDGVCFEVTAAACAEAGGAYQGDDVTCAAVTCDIGGEGEGEGEGEPVYECHTADQDLSHDFSVSELLRIIQFYNLGPYHCDPLGEDGYAPGPGDTSCTPHSSDFSPQNWNIQLMELLRGIQIYNMGGYWCCTGSPTEDGFCPVQVL